MGLFSDLAFGLCHFEAKWYALGLGLLLASNCLGWGFCSLINAIGASTQLMVLYMAV